ncbi:hypothetical protein BS1330_I1857 [Brucella suis 1330]|uniref:Uncharacterized protein n=2 Tax=Brucella TaxID=234 RepID=Q57B28_BRUAB|nr:hypothetical protein BR1863 [Brucella suis 1330]AAX75156.1 hypothetical protein BruAb1_1842 [Brucella abortus bv. 1 str. 9-941]AEM19175.1 hypothetical protein BS1330_I1857 [Brucella suis 1330]AEU06845.1 hypothetical protein BSVBI22_A1859 [Brucella suis VBI22]CDL77234.1 unnamed protein product [Brucella canis str. Oliveri]
MINLVARIVKLRKLHRMRRHGTGSFVRLRIARKDRQRQRRK